MKKFLALLAVVASFAFSSTAFAQNHHDGRGHGGVNLQVSPWGSSLNIGGRNGVTITEGYGGHRGWDNRGWDNRGWNNGYRGYRPPVVIIPLPRRDFYYYDRDYRYDRPVVTQRPYYYYDAYDREVYVDQYGRASYTGYLRGDRDCDCR